MTWKQHRGLWVREGNVHDRQIVDEIIIHDEYRMKELKIETRVELVVDLGAHIGAWSHLYHSLNPLAIIVCVEANPRNLPLLQANVGNFARTICAACTYNEGPCVSLCGGKNPSDGLPTEVLRLLSCLAPGMTPDFPNGPHDTVSTIALEDILGGQMPDVLKMDVEGAEITILENMMLLPNRLLIGEWHDDKDRWEELVKSRLPGWTYRERSHVFHLLPPVL